MEIHATLPERMPDDLQRAIDRGEFRLYYQPIVSLSNGRIRLFESMLRWKHPEKGLISSSEFPGSTENLSAALSVSRWVLREACFQVKQWQQQFRLNPLPGITVNISDSHFSHDGFISDIADTLAETELAPSALRLEISQHFLMEDNFLCISHLQQLKQMGVGLSIDHFGISHYSVTDLQRLPVDALKVDCSLIGKMLSDPITFQVLSYISLVASELGISLTADGVETPEQLSKLGELKCAYAQGTFFSGEVDAQTARMFLQMEQYWSQPVE